MLSEFLELEDALLFGTMEYGKVLGKMTKSRFSKEKLSQVVARLGTGDFDFLQLSPFQLDDDWVKAQETRVGIVWKSSVVQPVKRGRSPVEKRFGHAGNITITFPLSRFSMGAESPFQKKLVQFVKKLFADVGLYWAFIHQGFRARRPFSVGADDIFEETRESFPLTSFDADLGVPNGIFGEFPKGAFWANFLNKLHVEKLRGIDVILREAPTSIIDPYGDGRVLLQVGPSPLPLNELSASQEYQRLRRFLKPILAETSEERMEVQMKIIGDWRPPGLDADWKRISPRTGPDVS